MASSSREDIAPPQASTACQQYSFVV